MYRSTYFKYYQYLYCTYVSYDDRGVPFSYYTVYMYLYVPVSSMIGGKES